MVDGFRHLQTFHHEMDDFSLCKSIPASNKNKVITANGETFIEGKGTVFIQHNMERNGQAPEQWMMCILSPIYFISWLSSQLMSMGEFLHSGLEVWGSTKSLELIEKHDKPVMQCLPIQKVDTIYWVKSQTVVPAKVNVATVYVADYDIWHKWLGHVSQKALRKMPAGTQKFLRFKPQSSSLFAQAVPRARWNPDHSQNHNLVPWGCLSLSIQTWSLFQLNPTTGSSTLLFLLMISSCTCGQLTSERSLTHLKWSRTSRQWLESSMVPPSKDGKSIKGGSLSTPISWIP